VEALCSLLPGATHAQLLHLLTRQRLGAPPARFLQFEQNASSTATPLCSLGVRGGAQAGGSNVGTAKRWGAAAAGPAGGGNVTIMPAFASPATLVQRLPGISRQAGATGGAGGAAAAGARSGPRPLVSLGQAVGMRMSHTAVPLSGAPLGPPPAMLPLPTH
jgi:hypothetical protein